MKCPNKVLTERTTIMQQSLLIGLALSLAMVMATLVVLVILVCIRVFCTSLEKMHINGHASGEEDGN